MDNVKNGLQSTEMFFFDPLKNIECDGGFLFMILPCFWLGKRKCLCDANQSVILCMLLLYLAGSAVSLQIY